MANDLNSEMNDVIVTQYAAAKRLFLDFGQRSERASAQLHTDAPDLFGLEVDLEGASRSDIRVASGVSGSGAAAGEVTYSAHN